MKSSCYFLSFIYSRYSQNGGLDVPRVDYRFSKSKEKWIKRAAQIAIYWAMQNEGNCALYLYELCRKEVATMRRHPYG